MHGQLFEWGPRPRRKILLIGPPDSGKTTTATVLSEQLDIPFFSVAFESPIARRMSEAASEPRSVFEAMPSAGGVYILGASENSTAPDLAARKCSKYVVRGLISDKI